MKAVEWLTDALVVSLVIMNARAAYVLGQSRRKIAVKEELLASRERDIQTREIVQERIGRRLRLNQDLLNQVQATADVYGYSAEMIADMYMNGRLEITIRPAKAVETPAPEVHDREISFRD